MSSNAPGNWKVPGRDENGVYTGDYANSIDPNCGEREGFVPGQATTAFGSDIGNGTCYFEYGDNRDYRAPTDTNQFFANATYDVSDDLTLSGQFMSSCRQRIPSRVTKESVGVSVCRCTGPETPH